MWRCAWPPSWKTPSSCRSSAIAATATCRPAYSPADHGGRRRLRALALAAGLTLPGWASGGGAAGLQLELGRLSHPAFTIDGLRVELGAEGAAARLTLARLTVGERHWERLAIDCPDFRLAGGVLRCRGGTVRAPGLIERATLELSFDQAGKTAQLALRTDAGESIDVAALRDGQVRMALGGLAASRLGEWLPGLAAWHPAGRFDGHLDYGLARGARRIALKGRLAEGGFASDDGLQAAEQVALEIDLSAVARGAGWDWRGRLAWTGGAAYLHPLYLTAGPVVEVAGAVDADLVAVTRAALAIEGVRTIAAHGAFDLAQRRLVRAALTVADADLAVIGPRFLAPILMPARADALQFGGRLSAGIAFEGDTPVALDVAFDEAVLGLADGALGFGPVSGSLPWRADAPSEARLAVGGGHWQKLALGPFELAARLHGRSVDIDRVAIPVLDGALVLDHVALRRGATGWDGSGGAVVEPISMNRLTEAVGLPPMSGVLSASLPGLRVTPGEIALDGALVISVFDGYVQATRLQLLEPFGVASHLFADVEARHLDLAQLTETFSFGSVTGFIDADVRGLELARWRPVRFAARVASSPGNYPRRISQRAVQNIGALGGVGAAVAIQRSFLGFFETFGYREIGLSCVLAGGVCRMGGIDGDAPARPGAGFDVVRGGGIPALNVIGYNRRVDWNELVDRLQRVISSNTAPVVR
jgi:hypothetical protein